MIKGLATYMINDKLNSLPLYTKLQDIPKDLSHYYNQEVEGWGNGISCLFTLFSNIPSFYFL